MRRLIHLCRTSGLVGFLAGALALAAGQAQPTRHSWSWPYTMLEGKHCQRLIREWSRGRKLSTPIGKPSPTAMARQGAEPRPSTPEDLQTDAAASRSLRKAQGLWRAHKLQDAYELLDHARKADARVLGQVIQEIVALELILGKDDEAYRDVVPSLVFTRGKATLPNLLASLAAVRRGEVYQGQLDFCRAAAISEVYPAWRPQMRQYIPSTNTMHDLTLITLLALAVHFQNEPVISQEFSAAALKLDSGNPLAVYLMANSLGLEAHLSGQRDLLVRERALIDQIMPSLDQGPFTDELQRRLDYLSSLSLSVKP